MLIRVVQLSIRSECVDGFLTVFAEAAPRIHAFPGCLRLELWEDQETRGGFTTLSHWKSDEALDAYRNSSLFRLRWAAIKPMFAAKPRAFSYRRYDYRETCNPT